MSLLAWYPLNGDTLNRGSLGAQLNPTVSGIGYTSGILGQSLNTGSLTLTAEQAEKVFHKTTSIAFWLYPIEGTTSNTILGNSGMTPPNNRKFTLFQYAYPTTADSYKTLHWSWQDDESDSTYVSGTTTLTPGQWNHIAVVQSEKDNYVKIFINGQEKSSQNPNPSIASRVMTFKNATTLIHENALSNLADLRIYDHALSQLEVKELSRALILHYTFDDVTAESTVNLLPLGQQTQSNTAAAFEVTEGLENGATYTLSTYVTRDPACTSTNPRLTLRFFYSDGTDTSVSKYNDGGISYPKDGIERYYYITATANPAKTLIKVGGWLLDHSSGTGKKMTATRSQLEIKDHATFYTPTSRPSMINNETGLSQPIEKHNIQLSSDAASGEYSLNCHKTTWIKTLTSTGDQEQMTLAAWVNPRSYSGDCVIIGGCYLCVTSSGYLTTYCYGKNPEGYFSGSKTEIPLNTWTHIAVTWNATHCIGYVNGNEEFKVACTGTTARGGNHDKKDVGSENSVGNRAFDGLIDDVRVYNTSLSAEDIYDLAHTKGYITNTGAIAVNYLDEQSENLINEKDFAIPAKQTAGNGTLEMRKGVLSYGLQANAYYYGGDAPLQNHAIFKDKFKEGKQYYFDLYMDVDTMYYTDGKIYVPGGLVVRYTDGTEENVLATSVNGASGWQHIEYYSDPNKTIYGLGVYYYIGVRWYLRFDSGIYEVNKENAGVQQNYAMAATQFTETSFDGNALIHESGNIVGRNLIEG